MSRRSPSPSAPPAPPGYFAHVNDQRVAGMYYQDGKQSRYGYAPSYYTSRPADEEAAEAKHGVPTASQSGGLAQPLMARAVAVPPPALPQDTELKYTIPEASRSRVGRIHNAVTSYFSAGTRQRAKKLEQLGNEWAYPVAAIAVALKSIYDLRGALRRGTTNASDLLPIADKGVERLFLVAAVFMAHRMVHALSSMHTALSVRENILHSDILYRPNEVAGARLADDRRVMWKAFSHGANIAATGMLGYAAYRFALADPNQTFNNLGLLTASAVVEFGAKTFSLWSEQKRCDSYGKASATASGVTSGHIKVTGLAFLLLGASAALGNYASNHPNYTYSLGSAALAFAGLSLFASLPEMIGHRLTAKAVDEKLPTPANIDQSRFLGISMNKSTRDRAEELAMKAMLFAAVYTTKKVDNFIPLVAALLAVPVASQMIGKLRNARADDTYNRIVGAMFGRRPPRDDGGVKAACGALVPSCFRPG